MPWARQAATSTAASWACWAVSVFFLAGFRDELVLPCSVFGQTSFSYFPVLVVISVVSDAKLFCSASLKVESLPF